MSTTTHTRPAELLGVRDDDALALMVDRAVFAGGTSIEAEVRAAESKAIKGKLPPDQVAARAAEALRRCLAGPPRPSPAGREREAPEVVYSLAGGRLQVRPAGVAGAGG